MCVCVCDRKSNKHINLLYYLNYFDIIVCTRENSKQLNYVRLTWDCLNFILNIV